MPKYKRTFYNMSKYLLLAFMASGAAVADHFDAHVPPLNEYFKEVWTTREALPHNTVNDIQQTKDGYLWFATWEGVARYNGREFRIFERDETTQFADVGIQSLSLTLNGQLIAAGARGGISRQKGSRWQGLPLLPSLVTSVVEIEPDRYWVGTLGEGVFLIDENDTIIDFDVFADANAESVFSIRHVDNVGMLAATASGVFVLPTEYLAETHTGSPWRRLAGTDALSGVEVQDMLWAHENELYLATVNGLYVWSEGALQGPIHDTDNMRLTRLLLDHANALWLGSQDRGLMRLSSAGIESYSVAEGLPNNRVVSLFEDREQSIWVGTNSGLVRLRNAPFKSFTRADGLSDDFVRGLANYSKGGAIVATSLGLNKLENDKVSPFLEHTALATVSFLSVAEADDGTLWFGSISNGAYAYSDGELQHFRREDGLPANGVRAIKPLSNGDVWFGTSEGLAKYNGHQFIAFNKHDGLASDFVMSLLYDREGVLWVGTGDGVTQITKSYNGYHLESIHFEDNGGAQYIFGLHESPSSGDIWMATDRGLIRYRRSDGEFLSITREKGLNQDKFFEIVEDSFGYFWLSSNRGITRILKSEAEQVSEGQAKGLTVEIFGESDGMASSQANGGSGPAAILDDANNVLFATSRGVAVINSTRVERFDTFYPPVVIESIWVDGLNTPWSEQLRFAAGTRRVEFQFAGLGYVMPQRIHYRTRLRGFDDQWIERGTQNASEYTNLPPGDYTFWVEAYYPNAQDRASSAYVHFSIAPFIWQTTMFWVAIGVVLILFVILVYRWRLGTLKRSEARLRQQVEEKTQELERLAMEDQLTGLPNRRAFDARLRQEFVRAQRYGSSLCLAILDADHFKNINDQWSHETGDKVLMRLGGLLLSIGREVDYVARWGGEEFVLLMPETSLDDAKAVCERLRQRIEETDCTDIAPGLKLTVSIGVAASPGLSHFEKLLSKADVALYQAKQSGRNQVSV